MFRLTTHLSLATLLFAAALSTAACTKRSPPPDEPMAFRRYLLKEMPATIQAVNCTCCNKPLSQCFQETLDRDAKACPESCANCILEGRVALALKDQGLPDSEIARRTEAVSRGEEDPPAGVSLDFGRGHGPGHQH